MFLKAQGPRTVTGSLRGLRVVEFAGLGPAPFCAMMLADHGADIIRISKLSSGAIVGDDAHDYLTRSRRNIALDLKTAGGRGVAERLCHNSDVLIEGFRPGVMERLDLGPEALMAVNSKLIYARMTGWGQDGPYASEPGHDINYIALSGALHAIGNKDHRPTPPLNLVGDFGGGGMMLAFGILAALHSARQTGRGQIIDCSMVEGSATLMAMVYSLLDQDLWRDEREANIVDGGAPYYGTYETADGKYVAVGAVEPQFFAALLRGLGLVGDKLFAHQNRRAAWPAQRARLQDVFKTKSRDEWSSVFERAQACVTPVLSLTEVPVNVHNQLRHSFVGTKSQPAPTPKLSETPPRAPTALRCDLACTTEVLREAGYTETDIAELISAREAG